MTSSKDIVSELFALYRSDVSSSQYIGEPLSKLDHSLQAGTLAAKAGANNATILGTFFHDIGHLSHASAAAMVADNGEDVGVANHAVLGADYLRCVLQNVGVANHAVLGADYLRERGFEESVAWLVESHVDAKRYLCAVDPTYYEGVSWASRQTLKHQGGPMTAEEVAVFESNRNHSAAIQLRRWDEQAKIPQCPNMLPLEYFETLTRDYLDKLANQ